VFDSVLSVGADGTWPGLDVLLQKSDGGSLYMEPLRTRPSLLARTLFWPVLPSGFSMPQNHVSTRVSGPWVPLLTITLVVAGLWAAQTVLVPLALGIILAFMLTPLVRLFDRLRLPRFVGVAFTMLLALGTVGAFGYVITSQFADLSAQVSKYTWSMRQKVADLRDVNGAPLRQLSRTVDRVTEQLDGNLADQRRAEPVRVIPPRLTPIERVQNTMHSIFQPLVSAFIVLVLVAFMLGQREDLRDRFIRLLGADNVTLTTRLMDEAAQRVSQFLLAQTLINLVFGVLVGLGLYWIGVPYAALWGGLTAVLRFVPYVGTLLSALIPAVLAFAIFPGWSEALQTLGLFLILDMLTAYFVEPVVFGQRTGVSSFALLVSALFWIWVWGPMGLLLATPLTVCIAVLGRHVRSLRFLAVIFADEPALMPHVRYYQRLLARDDDEASALANHKLSELGVVGMMDTVLIPALAMGIQHRAQGEINADDLDFMVVATGEVVEQLKAAQPVSAESSPRIVGLAARSVIDQLVLDMLCIGVNSAAVPVRAVDGSLDGGTAIAQAIAQRPQIACVVALSRARGAEVRSYCRKLRAERPEAKLLVLRPLPADEDMARSNSRMQEAGADCVAGTIQEAMASLEKLWPSQIENQEDSDAAVKDSRHSRWAAAR
jgi:predicted PurR-regulated permease PerM